MVTRQFIRKILHFIFYLKKRQNLIFCCMFILLSVKVYTEFNKLLFSKKHVSSNNPKIKTGTPLHEHVGDVSSKEFEKKKDLRLLKFNPNFSHPLDILNFSKIVEHAILSQSRVPLEVINKHEFNYLNLPTKKTCQFSPKSNASVSNSANIIFLIKSSAESIELRQAIRESQWKNVDNTSIHHVFLLGYQDKVRPIKSKKKVLTRLWSTNVTLPKILIPAYEQMNGHGGLQDKINLENKLYGDIVQENFEDNYRNNTLKTIMAYNWAKTYCSAATFLVFLDDDFKANINGIAKYLRKLPAINKTNLFIGAKTVLGQPFRDPLIKWYIPYEDYPYDKFAPYVAGGAYEVTADVVEKFANAFPHVRPIAIDDAYLGIVAHKMKIQPLNDPHFNPKSKLALVQECTHIAYDMLMNKCAVKTYHRIIEQKLKNMKNKNMLVTISWTFVIFLVLLTSLICCAFFTISYVL